MVTKIKTYVGEVHRWRGRWAQTLACGNKINPTELHMDFPSRQDVAECEDRA